MSNPARGVRGVRAPTRDPAAAHADDGGAARQSITTTRRTGHAWSSARGLGATLQFRDRLRIEYDDAFRDALIHISGAFDTLPTRAWNEMRRDATRSDRPWARLLRVIDEACWAGAREETLLELPAILTAYIYERRAQLELTPAEGVVAIPESARRIA